MSIKNIVSGQLSTLTSYSNTTGTVNGLQPVGNSILGSNANVVITGGTAGQVLATDGTGNLSWVNGVGGNGSSYSNANVQAYLPTYTGNLGNVDNITATGNVNAPKVNSTLVA